MREAWIETLLQLVKRLDFDKSPLMREAWIETAAWRSEEYWGRRSPLMREAWIETTAHPARRAPAPCRLSCERRGLKPVADGDATHRCAVASHARGVD